jgi:mannose-6-phosphate isomerase-like protein (cupin superfamily)
MSTPPIFTNSIRNLKKAKMDTAVGIRIVKGTGADHTDLCTAEPGSYGSVTARYHKIGSEIYPIVHGVGTIHTGLPSGNATVPLNRFIDLKRCDCFTGDEGQVNPLESTGSEPMVTYSVFSDSLLAMNGTICPKMFNEVMYAAVPV